MRYKKLIVTNFGPYYGEQALTFGVERPIVIVHGKNMRGKTSLMNAIRWALYGTAEDRRGREIRRASLVNRDAADEGNWVMTVSLDFESGATPYRLDRTIQPKPGVVVPQANSDFEEKLFLRRDSRFLSEVETRREINHLLPKQIARFFLFDGELLNEYERLLADSDRDALLIRNAIEDILGVPTINHARVDLDANLQEALRRQRRLASRDQKARKDAEAAAELSAQIDVIQQDIDELRSTIREHMETQAGLDEKLQAYAGIEADVKALKDLKEERRRLGQNETDLLSRRREKLSDAWRDFLSPIVRPRLNAARTERARQEEHLQEVMSLRTKIEQLQILVDQSLCPVCKRPVDVSSVDSARRHVTNLNDRADAIEFNDNVWNTARQTIDRLVLVEPIGVVDSIRTIEDTLRIIRLERHEKDLAIDEISERLLEVDQAGIVRNRQEFEEVTREIGKIEHVIREREAEMAELTSKLGKHQDHISQLSGPDLARVNGEIEIYQQLHRVFSAARDKLRDALRTQVERDATTIFLQLTTDANYKGLRINENYGLAIIDDQDRAVTVRSAGAEQVVALSLIGALNRNAVRQGSIVMDTPFGRLDPDHRQNILRFIPTMSEQVTLLVHGGEIDRERDLDAIADQIDCQYTIERVSPRQSRLEVMGG